MASIATIHDTIDQGTLQQLDALHSQSTRLVELQNGIKRNHESIALLRAERDKLLNRHRLLKHRIAKNRKAMTLADVLAKGELPSSSSSLASTQHRAADLFSTGPTGRRSGPGKAVGRDAEGDESSREIPAELQQAVVGNSAQATQAQELDIAYRLSGRTAFAIDTHHVALRFDTSHKGKYFETYYVIVSLGASDAGGEDAVKVVKHTIPSFIDLYSLAKRYLPQDLQAFSTEMFTLLNSYVARRVQVASLIDMFDNGTDVARPDSSRPPLELAGEITTWPGCNYTSIDIKMPRPSRSVLCLKASTGEALQRPIVESWTGSVYTSGLLNEAATAAIQIALPPANGLLLCDGLRKITAHLLSMQ
ncbi:hypothetical protein CAOG_000102 [Capsaspora owczarzaki ATCC 30864]|uniref:Centromere protein O n=2 Tax=Capsaspora owczarzaki (strain ATCC 30864) TaxID=595528 RepID=A0A0D2WGC0_CAPO3|nr:hypothetical protein CAOG_000102 [Capsaspora owczarzaki ATCC 30864]